MILRLSFNELVDVVIMAEEILSMQKNCLMYMHYLPLQQEIKINDWYCTDFYNISHVDI